MENHAAPPSDPPTPEDELFEVEASPDACPWCNVPWSRDQLIYGRLDDTWHTHCTLCQRLCRITWVRVPG